MPQIFIWTFQDILGLVAMGIFLLFAGGVYLSKWLKTLGCKHENVRETMACDAVCTKCGKNLGFIGTWRKNSR